MPDCQLNRPYVVATPLLDAYGQPQTSAATGTLVVTDPGGAQVYSGAISLQGTDGRWGAKVPATAHTTAGVYRWQISPLTDGWGDGAQAGLYSVGQVTPDQQTLWEVYRAVARALRDGREGKASTFLHAGSSMTFVDPYYAYGAANNWNGAQVLLAAPYAPTDTNPLRVSAFDPATGTFTLTPSPTQMPDETTQRYLLGGLKGFTHEQKLDAILRACRDASPRLKCSDEVSLSGQIFTFQYAIPASWTSVRGVFLRNKVSPWQGDWEPVAPIHWSVRPDRRLLTIEYALTSLVQIRIDGRFAPPPPQTWGSYLDAPAQFVIDRALEYLCATSAQDEDKKLLQYYAAKAEEAMPSTARMPNEVTLG